MHARMQYGQSLRIMQFSAFNFFVCSNDLISMQQVCIKQTVVNAVIQLTLLCMHYSLSTVSVPAGTAFVKFPSENIPLQV